MALNIFENTTICGDTNTAGPSKTSLIVFMVTLGFTSVVGVLGNILVMLCIATSKKLQTFTNCLVLNLSIADLLVCAIFGPVIIYFWASDCTSEYMLQHASLCTAMGALAIGLCGVSIVSLAWISFNRYLLIVHGVTTYRKIFNKRLIPFIVAFSWLWGNSVMVPPFLGWGGFGYNDGKRLCDFDTSNPSTFSYEVCAICFYIGIPLTVTCVCYIRVFSTVRKSRLRVAQHAGSTGIRGNEDRKKKKDLKLTKDLFIIFGIFCLCLTPYAFGEFIDHTYDLFPIEFHTFANLLVMSNLTWNPFIYVWRNTDFRNAMKRILSLKLIFEGMAQE